jgi:hypothetical protein
MTSDKHLLIGVAHNPLSGPTGAMVLKTDTLGNIVWNKFIPTFGNQQVTASMTHQVEERSDKRIWALVRNNDPDLWGCVTCDKRTDILWLYCLDSLGNEVWKRKWRRGTIQEHIAVQTTVNMVLEDDGGAFIAFADANSTCCPEYIDGYVMFEPHYLRVNCAGFTGLPKAEIYNQSVISNTHTLHTKIWNTDSLIIEWGDGVKQRFSMIDTVFRDTVFMHTYPANGIYLHPNIKAYACGHVYESNGLGEAEDPHVHIQMQKLPLKMLSVYPNPSENYVWVTGTHVQGSMQGRIINMQGQVVKTFELNKEALRLDISEIPQGMYFVQVQGYTMQKLVRQ